MSGGQSKELELPVHRGRYEIADAVDLEQESDGSSFSVETALEILEQAEVHDRVAQAIRIDAEIQSAVAQEGERISEASLEKMAEMRGISLESLRHVLRFRCLTAAQIREDSRLANYTEPEVAIGELETFIKKELRVHFPDLQFEFTWDNMYLTLYLKSMVRRRGVAKLFGEYKQVQKCVAAFHIQMDFRSAGIYDASIMRIFGDFLKRSGFEIIRHYSINDGEFE